MKIADRNVRVTNVSAIVFLERTQTLDLHNQQRCDSRPVGMVRPADDDLLEKLSTTPLTALAKTLDIDVEKWLPVASSPLPVTLRLTSNRPDKEWTRNILKELGGKKIPWMTNSESWVMPFSKGNYPDEHSKNMMVILHETGRITRQEAVSMLPPAVLEPSNEDLVLDTCAAPGSKATQLAEMIPDGLVLANEPSSGRLNLLASNRGRLGLSNMIIMQHDGRHIGRMPHPGVDGVIVDAPCSGSATSRKNREIWYNWTPKVGRSLFKLQVDIAFRAANLLRPGGKMVYSTCSLDPIENEAVVCEILQKCPWLELQKIDCDRIFPGLKYHEGKDDWDILDEEGEPVAWEGEIPKVVGLKEEMLNPKQRGIKSPKLDLTIRVHQHDNDSGGFYVALFRHIPEQTPEGIAKSMILKRKLERPAEELHVTKKSKHASITAPDEVVDYICSKWGIDKDSYSWWLRGKRVNLSNHVVNSRIFEPLVYNSKGDFWPQNNFHPLRVIHVGQPSFTDNKGQWRVKQESLELLRNSIKSNVYDVELKLLKSIIEGEVPLLEDIEIELPQGSCIIRNGEFMVPVWVAARVSLMIDKNEQEIIRMKLSN